MKTTHWSGAKFTRLAPLLHIRDYPLPSLAVAAIAALTTANLLSVPDGRCNTKSTHVLPTAFVAKAGKATDVTVFDAAALNNALKKATSGSTIRLAPGNYGEVQIADIRVAGTVRITSLDAALPAIFTRLLIRQSSGLAVDTIHIDARQTQTTFPVVVMDSSRVALDHVTAVGEGYGPNPNAISAIILRDSTDVCLTRSKISKFRHGVTLLNLTNARIAYNELRDLRTDGIRGGGLSNSVIEGNVMTDFHPIPADHPDGIQLWSVGQETSASNIVIRNNLIVRGLGDATQGIFIREDSGTLPFKNVKISGNLVVGGRFNGIAVENIDALVVQNNIVAGYSDYVSKLRIDNSRLVDVRNNRAMKFVYGRGTTLSKDIGNMVNKSYSTDSVNTIITEWLTINPKVKTIFEDYL